MKPYIIGVSGRSGSGKTTLVRNLMVKFGNTIVSIHTMDNYYKSRTEQVIDEKGYLNFDLPESFERKRFYRDLSLLKSGKSIQFPSYTFNNKKASTELIIESSPIIFVEGLFIYHYSEINALLDYRVMIDLDAMKCYERRLLRDVKERNYSKEEVHHRYFEHVEPAYQVFINPYLKDMDLIIDNSNSLPDGQKTLSDHIQSLIN